MAVSRFLVAALICWAGALLLAFAAFAGPLDDLVKQYDDGTMFAADRGWDAWRERTSDRHLTLTVTRSDGDRTWALFDARALVMGEPRQWRGVVMIEHPAGVLTAADFHTISGEPYCKAAATGQAADIGTTGLALAQGFAEGNPLGVGLLPIKVAAYYGIRSLPLYQCMAQMQAFGRAGWLAAGWNLGFVVAGPPAGAVLALVAASLTMSDDDAALECAGC